MNTLAYLAGLALAVVAPLCLVIGAPSGEIIGLTVWAAGTTLAIDSVRWREARQ